MKTKKRRITALHILVAAALLLFCVIVILDRPQPEQIMQTTEETLPSVSAGPYVSPDDPEEKLAVFAQMHELPLDTWPEDFVQLLKRNPDAENYVLNYPFYKDTEQPADLTGLVGTGEVPRLFQWDARWGYTQYGDKEMGLTGCGPTCLSMVCLYYLQDAKYTPRYVADFAQSNDYYTPGFGSNWTLMSQGAQELGLNVVTIPPNAERIMANLEVGNLVILALGPSVFSTNGHFILLAGAEDGLAVVHDPNSVTNSETLWDVSAFRSDIQNVWVFQPIEE